jgi:hypothetical protein
MFAHLSTTPLSLDPSRSIRRLMNGNSGPVSLWRFCLTRIRRETMLSMPFPRNEEWPAHWNPMAWKEMCAAQIQG